ncbi:Chromatin assembly factor 1, subunit A [Bulinus truncatus]|nr:Chromatin assembly factor 1, subunit A [Bulinus truncatus]
MMEKMIENQPPAKKMKQAKLSFFKAAPVLEITKVQPQVQSKKRRNSNSLETPSSCAKVNKTLTTSDSPNSKVSKKRKLSSQKSNDDVTNEVSSSSEAESVPVKHINGKCCLLDRFVRVMPSDVHQEISSTNEVLDISVEFEADQVDKTLETLAVSEKSLGNSKAEQCIIIIDDDSSANDVELKSEAHSETDIAEKCPSGNKELHQKPLEVEVPESVKCELETDANLALASESVCCEENVSQVTDISIISEENCNESEQNVSFSSDMSSSTPLKRSKRSSLGNVKTDVKTPKTPVSSKKRKVDSSKKLEKESEKKKKLEEREREKLEKKRKLDEAKAEKERIKQEKKEAKEREKQEFKEKLEREKNEKEKAKEEERKKKEEERVKKEEEKKKKLASIEAKQEEKRKKEEEKLKEEEEKKKKEEKVKEYFQKYFIKPKDTPIRQAPSSSGLFIPFQVKKDMHLAPIVRRDALTEDKRNTLDEIMNNPESCDKTYLHQLRSGDIKPYRTGRVLRKNPQPVADVEVIHDSEILKKVTHQVKLLQFHTDHRPPYYGTWRKQPKISGKNPWKKDKTLFDYEVDSDEEWEEEEPGESLSCSDGEEDKGEEVEEEEDDGWMVPHGYLSEGEGCSEDEEITPEKLKRQQLAKAKAWEDEMNKKLQVAPLVTVGCFFEHSPSATMSGDVRLLYEFRAVVLAPCIPVPTSLFGSSEPEKEEAVTEKLQLATTPKGPKKKSVPDEAMPDLIRLVHGNVSGIKRLIREFRMYWFKRSNPSSLSAESPEEDKVNISLADKDTDTANVDESVNESVICETEEKEKDETVAEGGKVKDEDQDISKRQLDLTITSIAVREKREGFKKICWYVHEQVLKQYNMIDIQLPNTWVYLTAPPKSQTPSIKSQGALKNDTKSPSMVETERADDKEVPSKLPPKDQRSIKDFALSKEKLAQKLESQPVKRPLSLKEADKKIDTLQGLPDSCFGKSPVPVVQLTPKDKKSANQRSIMEFARKTNISETKSNTVQDKLKMKCCVVLNAIITNTESSTSSGEITTHLSDVDTGGMEMEDSFPEQPSSLVLPSTQNDADQKSEPSSSTVDIEDELCKPEVID